MSTGGYLRRSLLAITLSSVALCGLASCSSSSGGTRVNGTWDSFSARVDPGSVKAGKVTFTITNAAAIEHEFVVLQTATPQDQLVVGADNKAPETGKLGEIAEFKGPGVTKKLSLDLKAGTYVLICNIPTHYQKGVHTAFTVQ